MLPGDPVPELRGELDMVDRALGLGLLADDLPGERRVVVLDVLFQPGTGPGRRHEERREEEGREEPGCVFRHDDGSERLQWRGRTRGRRPGQESGRGVLPAGPDEVHGDARQDDEESDPRGLRGEIDQVEDEQDRQADVDQRGCRIAEGAVRPLRLGRLAAEHEHGADHQRVEGQVGRDDVFEQLIIEVPVLDAPRGGVGAGRDRQGQQRGPEPLGRECHRGDVPAVGGPDLREEEPVACHGIVDAGPGQDDPVDAAERRDQDRHGHHGRPGRAQDLLHDGGGHPVLPGALNLGERQRDHVGDVRQQVQADDAPAADQERPGEVAARVAGLARGERHVVPGRLREQGPDHRAAQEHRQGDRAGRRQALLQRVGIPAVGRRGPTTTTSMRHSAG